MKSSQDLLCNKVLGVAQGHEATVEPELRYLPFDILKATHSILPQRLSIELRHRP